MWANHGCFAAVVAEVHQSAVNATCMYLAACMTVLSCTLLKAPTRMEFKSPLRTQPYQMDVCTTVAAMNHMGLRSCCWLYQHFTLSKRSISPTRTAFGAIQVSGAIIGTCDHTVQTNAWETVQTIKALQRISVPDPVAQGDKLSLSAKRLIFYMHRRT